MAAFEHGVGRKIDIPFTRRTLANFPKNVGTNLSPISTSTYFVFIQTLNYMIYRTYCPST